MMFKRILMCKLGILRQYSEHSVHTQALVNVPSSQDRVTSRNIDCSFYSDDLFG